MLRRIGLVARLFYRLNLLVRLGRSALDGCVLVGCVWQYVWYYLAWCWVVFHFVFGCDYDNLINIAVGYHSACFASLLRHSIFLMKTQVSNKNPKGACKYWHKRAAFQRSAFGRLTAGNDVVATIFICLFFFSFGASLRRSSGRRSGGRLLAMT